MQIFSSGYRLSPVLSIVLIKYVPLSNDHFSVITLRLIQDTTGCLLVAANNTAARAISQQFKQGTVHKTYLALVERGTFQRSSGRISNHIKYLDGRGILDEDGKPAVTDWRLLASSV